MPYAPRDEALEQLARALIDRFISTERPILGITTDAIRVLCYYDRGANARIEIRATDGAEE